VPLKVAVQGVKGIAGCFQTWLPNDNQQTTIAGSKSRRMNSIKSIKVNGSTALDAMHKRSGFGWDYLPTIYAMQFHFLRYVYALETIRLHSFGRSENREWEMILMGKLDEINKELKVKYLYSKSFRLLSFNFCR